MLNVFPLVPVMNSATFPALTVGLAVIVMVTTAAEVEFVSVTLLADRAAVILVGTGTIPSWTVPVKPLTGTICANVTTVSPG